MIGNVQKTIRAKLKQHMRRSRVSNGPYPVDRSLRTIGKETGVHYSNLSRFVNGDNLSQDNLARITRYLGLTVSVHAREK